MHNELYKDLYERMRQEYLKRCKDTGRLRKALEEVEQTVLYSDVSSAETLCVVYGIVNQALEPIKGEEYR